MDERVEQLSAQIRQRDKLLVRAERRITELLKAASHQVVSREEGTRMN